jgi:hypothetical protein
VDGNQLCCFCRKTVLGIYGQDDLLASYNFLPEELDKRAVAEGVYGSCHTTCLLRSPWNDFWVTRRLGNYINQRGFVQIYEEQDGRIFRDFTRGASVIVLSSGEIFSLSDRDIKTGLDAASCSIGVKHTPLEGWELPAAQRGARMEDLFGADGYMPLLQLARYFDVQDKFRDNDQAARTRLKAVTGEAAEALMTEETAEWLSRGVLIAEVHCSVTLPHRLMSQLVANGSPHNLPLIPPDWSPPEEGGRR